MSTAAQATANVANARHSTGPRTSDGKRRSCRNALKHGLTAKTVLLPDEDPAEYQAFAAGIKHDLGPVNPAESALAQELVDLQWRLLRVSNLEARILSDDSPDFKALNHISLHASRMKRQFSATYKEFLQLQAARIRSRQSEMQTAALIRRADLLNRRPTDLSQFGFVFSVDEIDGWIHYEDTLDAAQNTLAGVHSDASGRPSRPASR